MLHRNVKKIVSYLLTFVLVLGLFMGIDLNVQADEEFIISDTSQNIIGTKVLS